MSASSDIPSPQDLSTVPRQEAVDVPRETYRSYKKKYNKMRHTFKGKMQDSNSLFNDEQKALKIARRLQEQNDQLLDLLLQVNESDRLPPNLCFDIRSPPPSVSALPALEPDLALRKLYSDNSAQAALKEARGEYNAGLITAATLKRLEADLYETTNKAIALSDLIGIPHSSLGGAVPIHSLPVEIGDPVLEGFLTLQREEEYLAILDATLDGTAPPPELHPIRSNEKEKEAAVRNPVSVYNWLRKHQPDVFLQDGEARPDKPVAKAHATAKGQKRGSTAPKQDAKVEPEAIDEEGTVLTAVVDGLKTKRKREDEPYRPKGGSSRPTKKKRVSGGQAEKKQLMEMEDVEVG